MQSWRDDRPLPFLYESTGVETYFTNQLDPTPRSRRVFAFHRPDTLRDRAQEDVQVRGRLQQMPALCQDTLWDPQVRAINGLEESLGLNKPRALVQMATGSGKTFTAVNLVYRLIRYGKVQRVLFLVDRTNLGDQAVGRVSEL